MSYASGTTHCSYPPREVGEATGMYLVIFVRSSPLLFFSLFLLLLSLFSQRLPTGGLGRGRTEPTRAAIETRDETRRSTGTCHVIFCCRLYVFVSSPHSSSFPLSTVQQQARLKLGRTGPTRAARETRDETVGQQVRVVYMICSLLNLLFLFLALLLFYYVQYF